MLLRNIENRVDVESVIAKIAFLYFKGCLSLFIKFDLVEDVKIAY